MLSFLKLKDGTVQLFTCTFFSLIVLLCMVMGVKQQKNIISAKDKIYINHDIKYYI